MNGPMRARIAAALLIAVCLISIYEPIHLRSLRLSPFSDIVIGLERASCLKSALPRDVHRYGFLPLVSQPSGPVDENVVVSNDVRGRLLILRYLVTPDLIADNARGPWVIADYADDNSALADIQRNGLQIVKDCGNGVFLLKR